MPNPRDLLICLLDYIKEQTKQVNPAAYRLANAKGFRAALGLAVGLNNAHIEVSLVLSMR
jgi:hypothetical protein